MSEFHIPNLKVDTITGPVAFNSTLTAPNATSVLSTQIANVQTNDNRYVGPNLKRASTFFQYDSLGEWVQVASFYSGGVRTLGEINCILGTTSLNLYAIFNLLFSFDPYGLTPDKDFPQVLAYREFNGGSPIESVRIRQSVADVNNARTTYFDVKYKSSTGGEISGTFANALLNVGTNLNDNTFYQISTTPVVNPDTSGQLLSSEFYLANNAIVKTTTGDFVDGRVGQTVINSFDNNIKIYADGAWRTVATW